MGRRKREECPIFLDCVFCADSTRNGGCSKDGCPQLTDSVADGAVSYPEVALKLFYRYKNIRPRLGKAAIRYVGPWVNIGHDPRLERARKMTKCALDIYSPRYFAALYLFASSFELFYRILGCFWSDSFHFDAVDFREITPHEYALYRAARDIYDEKDQQILYDMADREKVDDAAFDLILTALIISRYGPIALRLAPWQIKTNANNSIAASAGGD